MDDGQPGSPGEAGGAICIVRFPSTAWLRSQHQKVDRFQRSITTRPRDLTVSRLATEQ